MTEESTGMRRLKKVDVVDLMKKRDDILTELHKLPNKERDYKAYIRVMMRIKYHTDANERKRQHEKTKKVVNEMRNNDELRIEHNRYTRERCKARALMAS